MPCLWYRSTLYILAWIYRFCECRVCCTGMLFSLLVSSWIAGMYRILFLSSSLIHGIRDVECPQRGREGGGAKKKIYICAPYL